MSSINAPRMPDLRRSSLTATARCLRAAGAGALAALCLLVAHIVVPFDGLQIAALWLVGTSLLCIWIGVLAWRMPVFDNRALTLFAIGWGAGMALSIWLAGWALRTHPFPWRLSVQWLALTLSTAVGALWLRALLRKRATPLIGRLLSLISPLIVLLVIFVTGLGTPPR